MLKKILSLSLMVVMLVAMSSVAFAETIILTNVSINTITDADAKAQGIERPVEYLWVTQTTTDDVVSQKITELAIPQSSTKKMGEGNWVLARYNVGKNITFTKMTANIRLQMIDEDASTSNPQTVTLYCVPLSYTDYDAAKAIAGTTERMSTLVKPKIDDTNVKTYSLKKTSKNSAQTFSPSLNVDLFNGSSEYYHNGYVYLAFWANGQDGNYDDVLALQVSSNGTKQYSYSKLVFSGTQETPSVDDFSDADITFENGTYNVTTTTTAGEAYLIIASFNGTDMVDAKVAIIDASTAVDGVISGNIDAPAAGETVKAFLFDKTTLTPAISVTNF